MIFEDGKEMPLSAGFEFHHGSWKFADSAMLGEQVLCTLCIHPAAWHDMLKRIRSRQKLDKLRLGISANYEGVSGKVTPTAPQQKAMPQLIESCDFIGLSCRASFFGTDKVEKNPWTTPERIACRRDFYEAALQFLTTQINANHDIFTTIRRLLIRQKDVR